jgi:hypothetical protein
MKSIARALSRLAAGLTGILSLTAGLAVFASIPGLNLIALGYLLESAGRTARSGRWRDGFPGIRQASILGCLAAIGSLLVLPIRFISSLWKDATLLGESAPSFRITSTVLAILSGGMAFLIVLGLMGAGAWYFKRLPGDGEPRPSASFFGRARDGLIALLGDLQLPRLFLLGLQGWAGGIVWLLVPIGVLTLASRIPSNAALPVALAGVLLLTPVATSLPLLQARFAATGRFRDLFDWPAQRALFRQAPLASFAAVLVTFLAALPLYLLKVELPPRELSWLPGLLFIVLLWPARMLTGWAIHRANRRPDQPRARLWIWLGKLPLLLIVLAYGAWIWTMQYLAWSGAESFLEQHAFLLPSLR